MKNLLKLTLVGASMAMASTVFAATINLTGTVRDINVNHADFEDWCCGLQTGLVKNTLGADGTPVFNGGSALTTAANFSDWFANGGHNSGETQLTLALDNTAANPSVYSYSNNDFFPIDNQLGGNQGYAHNYHFTFRLDTEFTYTGGEHFTFTGDDDVWVYINKKLAIDLGGVHGAASQTVSLDSLGLTVGNDYALNLFFAERHTTQSSFRIDTSLKLKNDVPEPSGLLLLGVGLFGLGVLRNKKQA